MKIAPHILEILKKEKAVTLGFSGGKDSLVCFSLLRELNIKVIPFFFFQCPELPFVEKQMSHWREFFKTNIIEMPHPMLYDYLRHQDFQPPNRIEMIGSLEFVKTSFKELIQIQLESMGDTNEYWDVNGMKMAESLNRRLVLMKN